MYMGKYKELCSDNDDYPSMKNFFNPEPYPNEGRIIAALRYGKCLCAAPGVLYDVFTGERVEGEVAVYTDGTYEWPSDLIYYIKTYHLRLPEEFEKHLLRKRTLRDYQYLHNSVFPKEER